MMDASRSSEASKRAVSETQKLYETLLARPLDERQLARPSFKFIQYVVKSLITETRTLRNVFNSSDFESENKTLDKRKRADFLQKLIDFAANQNQPVVGCVAARIVAGLDPNKTNELLQSLAKIASARANVREPNRPRTFTKQSRGSALPPKASIVYGQAIKTSARKQLETQQQQDRRSSLRNRDIERPASRRVPDSGKSEFRSTSGSSSRNTSPRAAKQATSPVPISDTSVSRPTDDSQDSFWREAKNEKSDLENTCTGDLNSPKGNEITKPSSASRPLIQQSTFTSESDISKHMPQLRASLRALNPVLCDIKRFAEALKNKLTLDDDIAADEPGDLTGNR